MALTSSSTPENFRGISGLTMIPFNGPTGDIPCSLAHVADAPRLDDWDEEAVKVYGSETGPRTADPEIQITGGCGYLRECGMEQIWRHARTCAIYEGATGIHANGLATLGLRRGAGSDAIDELVMRLADGWSDLTLLDKWRALRETLPRMGDATPLAHRFYTASVALFPNVSWHKLCRIADQRSDTTRLEALATRVSDGKDSL
ncbi:MAG: hypothetical protein HUJ27_11225 [Rhodobacteraceae bacterium]|nr:hypothetical protein [Paracoccaceae bacterium]